MKVLGFTLLVFMMALTVASVTVTRLHDNNVDPVNLSTSEVLGEPSTRVSFEKHKISFNGESYEVALINGVNPDETGLFSNLEEPESAINIIEENNCSALVNAGFYTTNNQPIGQFVSNYKTIKNTTQSELFNGYFSINDFGTPRITQNVPSDNLRLSVQSGPLLIVNDEFQKLSIRNDKNARRIVVAVTGENDIVFIAIYDAFSKLLGPKLADLPVVLTEIENTSLYDFADALNLDGGSASAFYIDNFKLPESSPIGSYFCIN
ncbi:phosphodiester glycosidase family protein [Candidatus Woesebacteria bacterium]|nr:MAG: phosphodiester glycosidase family protein [Candidatus Woesebacteria bacterium]